MSHSLKSATASSFSWQLVYKYDLPSLASVLGYVAHQRGPASYTANFSPLPFPCVSLVLTCYYSVFLAFFFFRSFSDRTEPFSLEGQCLSVCLSSFVFNILAKFCWDYILANFSPGAIFKVVVKKKTTTTQLVCTAGFNCFGSG